MKSEQQPAGVAPEERSSRHHDARLHTGRPHSALDYQTPAAFATNSLQHVIMLRSVMAQRAGLLRTPPERAYSWWDSNPRWGILQWGGQPRNHRQWRG